MEKIIVKNPATGHIIQTVHRDSTEEIEEKLIQGEIAFEQWKQTDAYSRAHLLFKWSKAIQQHKRSIAQTMTEENGKPLKESLAEIDYATSYIDWYAEEAKRVYGRTIPASTKDKKIIVSKKPIGLVAAITPWNFPAAMMTRKAAPALAAGCTFIVKSSEETPLTTMRLIELAHDVGFPPHVIQYVNGRGKIVGPLFAENKRVRKLTFTGSTVVGKSLMKLSASNVKNITMELGGHAPVIIAEDADIDLAVTHTINSKFRNGGQTCVCANRIIVHQKIAKVFTERFTKQTKELVVGNGLTKSTDIGPVINQASFEKISAQIDDAITKGATLMTGNTFDVNKEMNTYFVHPTVLSNVSTDMLMMHEETFGPVAPIITYDKLEDAIQLANDTPYGLAAYFFTNDYRRGHYLFEQLDYGIIGWNDGSPSAAQIPFGGMKESGLGREGGIEGIEPYLETKLLSIGSLSHM